MTRHEAHGRVQLAQCMDRMVTAVERRRYNDAAAEGFMFALLATITALHGPDDDSGAPAAPAPAPVVPLVPPKRAALALVS